MQHSEHNSKHVGRWGINVLSAEVLCGGLPATGDGCRIKDFLIHFNNL